MLREDIIPILTAGGIGAFNATGSGSTIYWGDLPGDDPATDPDPVVAVYESPGPPGTYTKSGRAAQEGRLQVLTRSTSYDTAMQKALDVYTLLDGYRATISGAYYNIRAQQRPFDVGPQDEAGRTVISTNYSYHRY